MTNDEFISVLLKHEDFIKLVHDTRAVASTAPFEELYSAHLSFFGEGGKFDTFCAPCVIGFYDGLYGIIETHKIIAHLRP